MSIISSIPQGGGGGGSIPSGIICMWSGASNAMPQGWALCDGTNGTPDLRGRFVLGAGGSYAVGAVGGEEKHSLNSNEIPSHSHSSGGLTVTSAGDHAHSLSNVGVSTSGSHTHRVKKMTATTQTGYTNSIIKFESQRIGSMIYEAENHIEESGGHTHTVSGSTNLTGTHTHAISGYTASAGGSQPHNNMPPYYALCYIMKL